MLIDPVQKSEKQHELENMMQEIEFKQKQLVKLLNLKEILTSRQFLSIEEGKVKGKYQVALQSLIGFLADTKQATHDLQNSL